ncbi:Ldh family oxidoreductase [Bosea sp. BH3]|uniref:Ldh family oxidoreductase n=1 Tax=Bosea sp. BH3 TaxID=2871701 RepID=UPI0021CB0F35|nr:Ldh family oxidoreductase [Bosea sp. BH3]MCU4178885.1 Ldh family oxidoreductase [Bosea sp. BH3]
MSTDADGDEVPLTVAEALDLAARVMMRLGHDAPEAKVIADHLIDCELRGLDYGGLARILSVAERLGRTGRSPRSIAIARETPVSALVEGNDQIGYLVMQRATELALAKAQASGLAAIAGRDTWYTGMLSYYAERLCAAGLVCLIFSNASPWVAPHGGSEGRMGTNPICIGFPSEGEPVIWDIGTSEIVHAQVVLAGRMGRELPDGVAFGPDGAPTKDAAAALAGAFAAWGGHRGSGLALAVQLLGSLAGGPVLPGELSGFGFLIVTLDPALFTDAGQWRQAVADYAHMVRATRPLDPGRPVQMPFDRSRRERAARLAADRIGVPAAIHRRLLELAA